MTVQFSNYIKSCLLIFFYTFYTLSNFPFTNNFPKMNLILGKLNALTFVTVPNDNVSKNLFYQAYLPLKSWLLSCPNGNLLLITGPKYIDDKREFIEKLKRTFPFSHIHILKAKLGFDERPLIKSWFLNGIANTQTELAVFINSDILLESDFNVNIQILHNNVKQLNSYKNKILYIADRSDTRWKKALKTDISPRYYNDYISIPSHYRIYGCDLFIFNPKHPPVNFDNLDGFVVGFPGWDDCILSWSYKNKNNLVVCLDPLISIFHLEHNKKYNRIKGFNAMMQEVNRWVVERKCWDSPLVRVHQAKYRAQKDKSVQIVEHNHPNHF